VPAAPAGNQPPAQPQQQHQQKRGPIEGICRRKNIKLGWKKLDFVLRMVRRSFVDDALSQLSANPKKAAVFVLHAIANARNNAICAGGDPAKLWVAEAYVTKGRYRKYMAIMGRGNTGIKETRYSHLNVKVRQLDEGSRSTATVILRRRPVHVAPLVQRLQQGRRGRAVRVQAQQLQQGRRQQQHAH
jgi:large subunit ribosomal protein L22